MLHFLRPAQCLLFAPCLLLFSASFSSAQILNVTDLTSTPVPGVGHDYIKMLAETVNPGNGSVSLRAGVPLPGGRKLAIPFSFAYDSNGASHPESVGPDVVVWVTNTGPASKGGPYYQLSFTWRGKSSTRFLRPEQVEPMRQKVANYKRLRELMNEWVSVAVELELAEREKEKPAGGD